MLAARPGIRTWLNIHSTSRPLRAPVLPNCRNIGTLNTLVGTFDSVSVDDFREQAFLPEKPIFISPNNANDTNQNQKGCATALPALNKWFRKDARENGLNNRLRLANDYLAEYSSAVLPYEFIIDSCKDEVLDWITTHGGRDGNEHISTLLKQLLQDSSGESFHRFHAPFSTFLQAYSYSEPTLQRLYIAQAQIADLPKELQDDLPTPQLVLKAGKGDIYDANIWLGLPPTYTPLHKDPNPNLFVQLASSKKVRLFPPHVGRAIFYHVQKQIGQQSSSSFRGNEMMEGPETRALDDAVWGEDAPGEGAEVTVNRGDALFIPKGWWHSIKSVGTDVTMSVNWWFR